MVDATPPSAAPRGRSGSPYGPSKGLVLDGRDGLLLLELVVLVCRRLADRARLGRAGGTAIVSRAVSYILLKGSLAAR